MMIGEDLHFPFWILTHMRLYIYIHINITNLYSLMVKICQDLQMIADSARLFCLSARTFQAVPCFNLRASWSAADVILHGDHKASKDGDWKLQTDWTIEKKNRNSYGPVRMAPQLVEPGFGKDSKSSLRLLMKHILMLDCCCHSSFLKQMCFCLHLLKLFLQETSPALFAVFMRRACKAKHSWHSSRAWCSFNRWKKET